MIPTAQLFLSDLTCLETRALLKTWDWLLDGRDLRPVAVTAFGDWFLEDRKKGSMHFLDAGMGTLERVASSRDSWRRKVPEKRQAWLLAGQYELLTEAGQSLEPGMCFGWKQAPSVGGGVDVENLEPTPLDVHQTLCSRLAQRFGSLPEGTKISPEQIQEVFAKLEAEDDASGQPKGLNVRLLTAAAAIACVAIALMGMA